MNYFSQRLSKNPDTVPEEKNGTNCNFCFKSKALNQADQVDMLLVKFLYYI